MFELWRLNRELHRVQRSFEKEQEQLRRKKASQDEFLSSEADEHYQIEDIEKAIDFTISQRLLHEARSLDVETPPVSATEMWVDDGEVERIWLSSKGRAHVRKLIYEEKGRQLEVKTMWVTKIIIPVASLILATLVRFIGAITGLIAVLHRK